MFDRIEEKGRTLPFTRWNILLSAILGNALLVALAYSAQPHGWSLKRCLLVGAAAIVATCAAQNRKVALGCAFSIVALRMGVGLLTGLHPMVFIAGTIAAGCAAWLFLHDLDYT
jgi:hypothetical protein